jgi:hypothetical protein
MRTLTIIAVILGAALAYFGYWHYQYARAESDANRFCTSVSIGSSVSDVTEKAKGLEGFRHGLQENESRYIAVFPGPIFNAFVCELTLADGKVSSAHVSAMDD